MPNLAGMSSLRAAKQRGIQWLSGGERLLLLQRAGAQFPAPPSGLRRHCCACRIHAYTNTVKGLATTGLTKARHVLIAYQFCSQR